MPTVRRHTEQVIERAEEAVRSTLAPIPLAAEVGSDRADWLTHPAAADPYRRLRVYDTAGTRDVFARLVGRGGRWRGRTWAYVNVMDGQNWGLRPGDTGSPLMAYAVGGSPGAVRLAFSPRDQTAMDVRLPAWRERVAARCATLVGLGHKGVFLDDFNLIPSLVRAPGLAKVPVPNGWPAAMVVLAGQVRQSVPPGTEVIINLPPAQVAWNGAWVEWSRFPADVHVLELLQLRLGWEIERGFSDPAIRGSSAAIAGLASCVHAIKDAGRKVVIDDQSGRDPQWQAASFRAYVGPRHGLLAPSVDPARLP